MIAARCRWRTMPTIRERQSPEYRKIRDELLEAEIALKDQKT